LVSGHRTKARSERLNELITDTITFGLEVSEALSFIRVMFGETIGERSYYQRKAKLTSDKSADKWLSYFSRVGFVKQQRELLDIMKRVEKDRLRQYFVETSRNQDERNERLISQLNYDIRENTRLIADLMDGTPVIAMIKAKLIKERFGNLNGNDSDGDNPRPPEEGAEQSSRAATKRRPSSIQT
jgi:hypothetical protein